MAEETYSEAPYRTKAGEDIVLKSPYGAAMTKADVIRYAQEYEARIGTVAGQAYEAVNQPIQAGNRKVQAALPGPSLYDFPRSPEAIAATKPQGILDTLKQVAGGTAKTISQFAANQVDTPGEVGTIAGLAATHPLTRNLSTVLPAVRRTVGAAVGNLAGNSLTDPRGITGKHIKESLLTLVAVGGAESIAGVITKGLGAALSDKANKQVMDDIKGAIRKKYPDISLEGPSALAAYGSTKAGLDDIVRAGIKGLRSDSEDLAKSFITDLNTALPGPLSKDAEREVNNIIKQINTQSDKFLNNIGNDVIEKETIVLKEKLNKEMTDIVSSEFRGNKGVTNQDIEILAETWAKYQAAQDKYESGAKVLSLLRESGEGGGFIAQRFQTSIKRELGPKGSITAPDNLMNSVMSSASRGAPIGSVDKTTNVNLGALPNWITKSNKSLQTPLTRYVGKVRGQTPFATMDAYTNEEIKRFVERKD